MKKTFIILSAFVALMATSCQKETDNAFEGIPLTGASVQESSVVCYIIDGVFYRVVVQDDATNATLLQKLMDLVQKGHRISLYREDLCQQDAMTKDVVHYDTKDQKEMEVWVNKMVDDGYVVEVVLENGVYHGTATKK